jgi:hypothetical protein
MTPLAIDPATFRFVAQFLKHCATVCATVCAIFFMVKE